MVCVIKLVHNDSEHKVAIPIFKVARIWMTGNEGRMGSEGLARCKGNFGRTEEVFYEENRAPRIVY